MPDAVVVDHPVWAVPVLNADRRPGGGWSQCQLRCTCGWREVSITEARHVVGAAHRAAHGLRPQSSVILGWNGAGD